MAVDTEKRPDSHSTTQDSEYKESSSNHDHEHVNDKNTRLPRALRALKDPGGAPDNSRTLIICLDGTGDQFDNDNSNVVNFVSCLRKHSQNEQVTYYQSGIGTYDKGGLKNGIGAAMDMAVGSGLGTHIKDAYKFLMQNYRDGDRICLFGFSRGAYTVRCLAGMLHKIGLLPASNISQINFAYNFYKENSNNSKSLAEGFKKTFCTHVDVYFVGVWDCVASVGFIPRKLPFSKSPTNSIRHFRHAMALDEHRAKFKVCHWSQQNPTDLGNVKRRQTLDLTPSGRFRRRLGLKRTPAMADGGDGPGNDTRRGSQGGDSFESKFASQEEADRRNLYFEADVLEVWFMGCHADVGGGAVKNDCRHMLSRIPLRWMIRQCFECNTGILFDTARLAEYGMDVHTLWPVYKPPSKPASGPPSALLEKYNRKILAPIHRRSVFLPIGPEDKKIKDAPTVEDLNYILPSEGHEDYFDALERCNDMLRESKAWWILEAWPIKVRVLARDGMSWEKRVRLNLGRYRAIRDDDPKMHWTVQHAIDQEKYTLRNRCTRSVSWAEVV